jgi:hypothetical protein
MAGLETRTTGLRPHDYAAFRLFTTDIFERYHSIVPFQRSVLRLSKLFRDQGEQRGQFGVGVLCQYHACYEVHVFSPLLRGPDYRGLSCFEGKLGYGVSRIRQDRNEKEERFALAASHAGRAKPGS